MEAAGVSCDVIDLATVSPIDVETIVGSVERTGRLVIIQEAPRSTSVSSEVAAEVAERCLWSLEAPIQRICGYDTPMPLFKLEHDYMPSVARIVAGIRRTLEV